MNISCSNMKECDSLESFLHFLLNRKMSKDSNLINLYFRGESKYHKFIIPSLYLNEYLTMTSSEYYYRSLLSQLGCADYYNSFDLFRQISEFQHYGAKTRILDITSNPLIALYFAVEKYDGEPGYVYIYSSFPKLDRYDRTAEQFDVGHTVAVKSALNLISQNRINRFLSSCQRVKDDLCEEDWNELKVRHINSLHKDNIQLKTANYSIDYDCYRDIFLFMDILNQRAKTNEALVYPLVIYEDLIRSHIVLPSKCTDRIKQQQGAFIFPKYVNTESLSLDEVQKEIDESVCELSTSIVSQDGKNVCVIKISANKKNKIRDELSLIGITEGFVYPEIEHQSNTILRNLDKVLL